MPHTSTKIYRDAQNNLGVDIEDIQAVIGSSRNDIGALIVNGNINPMAKYKPVKSSTLAILTDTDRRAAKYGMEDPVAGGDSFLPPATPPAWVYDRPTQGAPNEWFRFLDFDGYVHNAVCPVAMIIRRLTIGGRFGIEVYMDSYVNAYYSNIGSSKQWAQDGNLSIDDLLSSGTNGAVLAASYVGFVFQDQTNSQYNLVITNKRFGDIYGVETFIFHPEGDGASGDAYEDGLAYPPIPILNESNRAGRNFKVTMAVFPYNFVDPLSYAYHVVSGYTITGGEQPGYSIGFDANDRTDMLTIEAWSASFIGNLRGVLQSGPALQFVRNYDSTWAEYEITTHILGTLITPLEWQNPANLGVSVTASVIGGTGFIGSTPVYPTPNFVTKEKSIALTLNNHTYTDQDLATFTEHVFLPRGVSGMGITITAKFTQLNTQSPIEAPFDNSLSLTI